MTGFNVAVGDMVALAPNKLTKVGDMELERGLVLEVDHFWDTVKVVFCTDDQEDERQFDFDSVVVDKLSTDRVIDIERDYKIMDIADTMDVRTNQEVSILTMARITKNPIDNGMGYTYNESFHEKDTDTFIFMGIAYSDIADYLGTVKRVNFSNFKIAEAVINGIKTNAYYAIKRIFEPAEMFSI